MLPWRSFADGRTRKEKRLLRKSTDSSKGFMRDCDTCGQRTIPVFDANTTCPRCKVNKWHEEHPETKEQHTAEYMKHKHDMDDAKRGWYEPDDLYDEAEMEDEP